MSMATVSGSTSISPSRPSAAKMCTLLSAVRMKTFLLSSEWTRSSGLAGSGQLARSVQRERRQLVFLISWGLGGEGQEQGDGEDGFLEHGARAWVAAAGGGPELVRRSRRRLRRVRPHWFEFQRLLTRTARREKRPYYTFAPAECARSNNTAPADPGLAHRPPAPGFLPFPPGRSRPPTPGPNRVILPHLH